MKIYVTKPAHTKYGRMKLDTYSSVEDLIENSTFWFDKPKFEKPFKCFLTDEISWNGFTNGFHSMGSMKNFPEGEVKEVLKKMIRNSINEDFSETLVNRHYKWIGELDVDLIASETSGNFNLYLTKPDAIDIKVAGIDRAIIWLYKPTLKKVADLYTGKTLTYQFDGIVGIKGLFFRKREKALCEIFWQNIVDSFDIQFNNMNEFYHRISNKNHKKGQSPKKFIKEYYFNLLLRGDV